MTKNRNRIALGFVIIAAILMLLALNTFGDVVTHKGDTHQQVSDWDIGTPTPAEITGEPYDPPQPQPRGTCYTVDDVNYPCN